MSMEEAVHGPDVAIEAASHWTFDEWVHRFFVVCDHGAWKLPAHVLHVVHSNYFRIIQLSCIELRLAGDDRSQSNHA